MEAKDHHILGRLFQLALRLRFSKYTRYSAQREKYKERPSLKLGLL